MDGHSLQILLLLAAALLASAAVAGVFALQLHRQQERLDNRIASVTAPYFPDAPQEIAVRRTARRQVAQKPVLHQLANIFGYDPTRREQYPVKWFVVLPASLIAARLGALLLQPLVGWAVLPLMPIAALMLCRWFYGWCDNNRRSKLFMQFPDALSTIVRGVRVGIPIRESMNVISREAQEPTAGEFRRVAERVTLGMPIEDALVEMAERNPLPEYRFFAVAIGLQAQTGGGLSETLDNLADVIRRRVALRARAYALAAEARISIVILCALPIVSLIALAILSPAYIVPLFTTIEGRRVLAAAAVMYLIGLSTMKYIVKKSLS